MNIIIHRVKGKDADDEMKRFLDELSKINHGKKVVVDKSRRRIMLDSICIEFRFGDFWKMAGCRVVIFNTDSNAAADFLLMSASKVNGFEVSNLYDLVKIVAGIKEVKEND